MLRTIDEYGKTLELCLLPFCADDPIRCHSLVPGSLRTEEIPSALVGAKLLFLLCVESGALPLLVRVDGGLFCSASGEGLETGGMHQALLCELLDKLDVDGAPGAGGLAGSEANRVAGFVEALSNAVNPTEAQGYFYGFRPGDAGLSGIFFVEADE